MDLRTHNLHIKSQWESIKCSPVIPDDMEEGDLLPAFNVANWYKTGNKLDLVLLKQESSTMIKNRITLLRYNETLVKQEFPNTHTANTIYFRKKLLSDWCTTNNKRRRSMNSYRIGITGSGM